MSKMEVDRERRVTLFNATNDPTFPHSSASQQAFVRELVAAMFKMPVGGITAALVDDWLLDEAIAERAAWEILTAWRKLHLDGALVSFREHMQMSCDMLKVNKWECTKWVRRVRRADAIVKPPATRVFPVDAEMMEAALTLVTIHSNPRYRPHTPEVHYTRRSGLSMLIDHVSASIAAESTEPTTSTQSQAVAPSRQADSGSAPTERADHSSRSVDSCISAQGQSIFDSPIHYFPPPWSPFRTSDLRHSRPEDQGG